MICQNTIRPPQQSSNRLPASSKLQGNYHLDLDNVQKNITTNRRITEGLRWLNRLLLGASLLIVISLIFQPRGGSQAYPSLETQAPAPEHVTDSFAPHTFESRPLAYYLAPAQKRNLFESVADNGQRRQEIRDQFAGEVKNSIRLVGIMLDQRPQVILEIISSGETVFMEEGQRVKGAQIKSIDEDRVTFLYKGEELELKR